MNLSLNPLRQFCAEHDIVVAYLFGSRAEDRSHERSDCDLAFVLRPAQVELCNLPQRLLWAEELSLLLGIPTDLIFLQRAPILLRFEIISKGVVVFCADENFRTDFEELVMRGYHDFKPFVDQYYREEAEAVRDGHFFAKR